VFVILLAVTIARPSVAARQCDQPTIARHVADLRAAQAELSDSEHGEEHAIRFFRAIPTSFGCFNEIFGYPRDQPGPLYSDPQLHDLFPRLAAAVPQREYARKLVRLAVGGHWEADQTGALQEAVRAVLEEAPAMFVGELKQLGDAQEYSVWQFLFGGPHPSNVPLSAEQKRRICSLSRRSCTLEAKAYSAALVKEEHH
jgi:hypothetical protein